jgi:predicted metal-dependent HD superfamily phosphohydrolase
LLERLVKAHPGNVELTSRLAAVYERRKEPGKARAVLEPLRDKLGASDGARILGMIEANQGHTDAALALLRPYTKGRLERLRAAQASLAASNQALRDRMSKAFGRNRPPTGFDAGQYKALRNDSERRKAMVRQYVQAQVRSDPAIAAARARVEAESGVVAVALDLGMILLAHAQHQADPAARKAELDEAEATLLAVARAGGESARAQLGLGQVYYWQGKLAEGRAQFDRVLAARKRDPHMVLMVAHLLREVGSQAEARTLAEEAYDKAGGDEELRTRAAVTRGLLGTELDDRIAWLQRASPAEPAIRAILSADLGRKAIEQGQDAQAASHLREAVRLEGSAPEGSGTLNNAGLALLMLSTITGDEDDFARGVAKLEKAVALDPANSLALLNAAETLRGAALREVVGRSIELRLIKKTPDWDVLSYLYADEAGRDRLVARLRENATLAKALGLFRKASLLAPRRSEPYAKLAEFARFVRDTGELRTLLQKLESVELDLADETTMYQDYYTGRKDAEWRSRENAQRTRAEQGLEAARSRGRDLTFAVAAGDLVKLRVQMGVIGETLDPDALVALAEEADAAASSESSRNMLIGALMSRANAALARSYPDYAKLANTTSRSVSDFDRVAFAVSSGSEPLRTTVLGNADVGRVIALTREALVALPRGNAGLGNWALLLGVDAGAAATVARTVLASEPEQLERAIQKRLRPLSGAVALRLYWAARLEGKGDEARAVLKASADRGVPLPTLGP